MRVRDRGSDSGTCLVVIHYVVDFTLRIIGVGGVSDAAGIAVLTLVVFHNESVMKVNQVVHIGRRVVALLFTIEI